MAKLQIHQFLCLSDNYGVLIHDPGSGRTASIDAPEAAAVERALQEKSWELSHILVTHHHADHVGGIEELKDKWRCRVVGNGADAKRIPALDETVTPGERYDFAGQPAVIIDTPGHTVGHVAWHFAADEVVFVGDTLFALGCGRVFEGSFEEMWSSLKKLKALPADTAVYCGHEYTQSNARFALTIDPENSALKTRARHIDELRARSAPTLPTTIGLELETNPFLRPDSPVIRARLGMKEATDADVFAEIRRRKDRF